MMVLIFFFSLFFCLFFLRASLMQGLEQGCCVQDLILQRSCNKNSVEIFKVKNGFL
ncbi:hypothetical protein GLYMA_02G278101v4 [Glycine max]|nr:hypothetical protein GLYMA_02G278101v4 [Glycine max]KAH1062450.1 hypothetical protein GYH30_005434 [Glycine max]